MKQWIFLALGAILVLVGAVWTLQGLDIMGGSPMSGVTLWAVLGPILALVGLGMVLVGFRQRRKITPGG